MSTLDQLRAAYVPRLRTQLDELSELLTAGEAGPAARLAHKIAGSAGSYGLPEVSERARAVEHALDDGGACVDQAAAVAAMRAALPELEAVDDAPVILVVGTLPAAPGLVVTDDPIEALEHAMDRTLRAVVVPYTAGARGGRALLRSLSGLDSARAVPIFLTEVGASDAEAICAKVGATAAFEGAVDGDVIAAVRERIG